MCLLAAAAAALSPTPQLPSASTLQTANSLPSTAGNSCLDQPAASPCLDILLSGPTFPPLLPLFPLIPRIPSPYHHIPLTACSLRPLSAYPASHPFPGHFGSPSPHPHTLTTSSDYLLPAGPYLHTARYPGFLDFLGALPSSLPTPSPAHPVSHFHKCPSPLSGFTPPSGFEGVTLSLFLPPPTPPSPVWVLLSKGCTRAFTGSAHKRPWELFLGTFSRHTRSTTGPCSKEPVFIKLQT